MWYYVAMAKKPERSTLGSLLYSKKHGIDRSTLIFYKPSCLWKDLAKRVEARKINQCELDIAVDRARQLEYHNRLHPTKKLKTWKELREYRKNINFVEEE